MFTELQSPRKNDGIGRVPLTFQSAWPHIIVESIVVGRTFSFSSHIRVSMQFHVSHSAIFWMMEITGMTYSGRPFCKKQLKTWEHIFGLSRLIPKKCAFPSQPITHWILLLVPKPVTLNLIIFSGVYGLRLIHALANKGIQATQTLQRLIFHSSHLNPTTSTPPVPSLSNSTPLKMNECPPKKRKYVNKGKYLFLLQY